jgi:signal transduction histidine kinase
MTRFPVWLLTLALLVTVGTGSWLAWSAYHSSDVLRTVKERDFRVARLAGEIVHLDEVLTMSARMAASTGDLAWEERYRRYEPQLDRAIKEAMALAPPSQSAVFAAQTDAANTRLIEVEGEAFGLIRAGRTAEARELLGGEEYARQKVVYADGVTLFLTNLDGLVDATLQTEQSRGRVSIGIAAAGLPIAVLAWLAVLRGVRSWRKDIEARVTQRTRELAAINAALLQTKDDAEAAGDETRDQLDVTRAIVDAAGVAMVLVAPDSRPMIANGLIEEYLGVAPGITPAEFVALMPKIFADPSAALALGTPNLTAPDAARTAIVSILWPTPREVEARVIPVRKRDGTPIGRLLTFRDVTREREVDRLKTEFVALVSHELRTPLTSIKGYVDLLIDGEVGAVNDDQHDFLGVVQANADRLVRLIDDLLDVSAIEAGKVHLELAPTDPAALIRAVLPMLRTQIEAKGQTLTLDLPDDLPPVLADAARIAQVVTNLLSNANKYTPAGGAIGVSAHAAHGALRVSVSDSGIGLTAAERGKLFTKFFRADNRTTREVAGTGLGLAISQSMVELHGGAITVESDPGRGSTFSFTVPLAPAPQVAASSDPDAASAVRGAWMAVAAGAAQWG